MSRRWLIPAGVALATLVWFAASLERSTPPLRDLPRAEASAPPRDAVAAAGAARPSTESPSQLSPAPSLRDSEIDGVLGLDDAGQLRIDRDLRHLFDYFLAGIGELSLPELRAALARHAEAGLGQSRVAEVLAEFDRYVEYLRQLSNSPPTPGASLADQHQALIELRRALLGEERAEAWFGDEERYTARTLERLAGAERTGSDDPETAQWLAAQSQATEHHLALEQTVQFEQLAMPPEQRQQERELLFGPEAAARLAALDNERALWQARLADYVQLRNAVRSDPSLTVEQQDLRIAAIQAEHFDPRERVRLQALEESQSLGP